LAKRKVRKIHGDYRSPRGSRDSNPLGSNCKTCNKPGGRFWPLVKGWVCQFCLPEGIDNGKY